MHAACIGAQSKVVTALYSLKGKSSKIYITASSPIRTLLLRSSVTVLRHLSSVTYFLFKRSKDLPFHLSNRHGYKEEESTSTEENQ